MKKILFYNAINTQVETETRFPQLGLGYLISSAEKKYPGGRLSFRCIEKNPIEEINDFKPDLVGITAVSQNFGRVSAVSDYCLKEGIPTLLGGIHCTLLPQSLPKSASAGCLGEGEDTFVEVVDALFQENLLGKISKIPGLFFWEKDVLCCSPPRERMKNLDVLPFPAREHFQISHHTYMFSSRGCPFRCVFCASSRYWDTVRFFSAEYVVSEIEFLVKQYKVDFISFFDDLFAVNRKRLEEIIMLLQRKGLAGKVAFTMNCRADIVDHELVELARKMGVVSVGFGFESGDEETLQYLKGKAASIEKNYNAVKLFKEKGIFVNGSFVIGSPRETKAQMGKTFHFIKKSAIDLFDIYILTPYPGTPLWDYAQAKGIIPKDFTEWNRLDVNVFREPQNALILSETLHPEEVLKMYEKFRVLRFLINLKNVWRHPLRRSLPRMMYKNMLDFVYQILRKISFWKP